MRDLRVAGFRRVMRQSGAADGQRRRGAGPDKWFQHHASPCLNAAIGWRRRNKVPGNLGRGAASNRSEEHTSELQSLMRISYAVFCLKKKKNKQQEYQYE